MRFSPGVVEDAARVEFGCKGGSQVGLTKVIQVIYISVVQVADGAICRSNEASEKDPWGVGERVDLLATCLT
jgi:hypothetical protein